MKLLVNNEISCWKRPSSINPSNKKAIKIWKLIAKIKMNNLITTKIPKILQFVIHSFYESNLEIKIIY